MKRWQAIVLTMMAVLAISLFCGVVILSQALFQTSDPAAIAAQLADSTEAADATAVSTPRPTATPTASPTATNTPSPTSTETPPPTATATRVVVDTPTPTTTYTPLPTPIPTATNTPIASIAQSNAPASGSNNAPIPASASASAHPFKIIAEPIAYKTKNHIFVILAKVMADDDPLSGYRLVGTQSPTGFQWESVLSCPDLCKASGPEAVYNEDGETIKKFDIQKGNLFFESPLYETGVWSLMLVDAQGQQVSDVFQLALDSEDKLWFYYVFSRQ